jgi:protein TonB
VSAATLDWQPVVPDSRRLQVAIVVSLAVHALLLMLHFSFPDSSRAVRDKALDIILVNAKSAKRPDDAQARAQANLDGGGDTDENRRIATPLPPTPKQATGTEIERMQRRMRELEVQQQKMLTTAKSARAEAAARQAPEKPVADATPSGFDLTESARAMARLEGEINRNVDEYNKRPRKKFIGARTAEYVFAQYIEDWRHKVERIGTLNYPDAARGKLYGSLVMTVSLNADGSLASLEINRSSGFKVLDDAARRIVQMASPYAPFTPEMKREVDILVITRSWYFTQGDQLSAANR